VFICFAFFSFASILTFIIFFILGFFLFSSTEGWSEKKDFCESSEKLAYSSALSCNFFLRSVSVAFQRISFFTYFGVLVSSMAFLNFATLKRTLPTLRTSPFNPATFLSSFLSTGFFISLPLSPYGVLGLASISAEQSLSIGVLQNYFLTSKLSQGSLWANGATTNGGNWILLLFSGFFKLVCARSGTSTATFIGVFSFFLCRFSSNFSFCNLLIAWSSLSFQSSLSSL